MNQNKNFLRAEELKIGIYNPIIWRLNIQGKEKPSRNDYIQGFGLLPDFVLKANGILISEQKEKDKISVKTGNLSIIHIPNTDSLPMMLSIEFRVLIQTWKTSRLRFASKLRRKLILLFLILF
ncbi:hypothetical protein [Nostoc sp. DSM 114167]|jgi:hypothetical protein|uniref:hypothetical protein n=1 Tax=Nostoc sp. DSM 114167 TaxID=3439050 RepID=UPI0040454AFB